MPEKIKINQMKVEDGRPSGSVAIHYIRNKEF